MKKNDFKEALDFGFADVPAKSPLNFAEKVALAVKTLKKAGFDVDGEFVYTKQFESCYIWARDEDVNTFIATMHYEPDEECNFSEFIFGGKKISYEYYRMHWEACLPDEIEQHDIQRIDRF